MGGSISTEKCVGGARYTARFQAFGYNQCIFDLNPQLDLHLRVRDYLDQYMRESVPLWLLQKRQNAKAQTYGVVVGIHETHGGS
jgi:hypothetical protein